MATLADIQALGYSVVLSREPGDGSPAIYFVSGYGLELYVDSADQELVDAVANADLHAERRFQTDAPTEQVEAKESLERKGYTLDRQTPDADVFHVTGGAVDESEVVAADLVTLNDDLGPADAAARGSAAQRQRGKRKA